MLQPLKLQVIEDNLNSHPRKSLGWYTPNEEMAGFLTSIKYGLAISTQVTPK